MALGPQTLSQQCFYTPGSTAGGAQRRAAPYNLPEVHGLWVAGAAVVIVFLLLLSFGMWWGPSIGAIGGIIGGANGCFVGIKRTELPEERRFMIWLTALRFLLIMGFGSAFLFGAWLLPGYYCFSRKRQLLGRSGGVP